MAYSVDFRQRVIEACVRGMKTGEVAEAFGVAASCLAGGASAGSPASKKLLHAAEQDRPHVAARRGAWSQQTRGG